MIILYRLFVWLYRWGALCISPFNKKARLWLTGRKNIFELLGAQLADSEAKLVWFHCASLGEFEQARPLIELIRNQFPDNKILLTFFSPSGYEIRKNYPIADYVSYIPMDGPLNAQKFLGIVQPSLVIWVKYEYWLYYLTEIKKRNIPLLLVSGIFREGQPFFRWYGGLHRKMLSCFTWFFVQNDASKRLLGAIGLTENVTVCGDTRFDRVIEIASQFQQISTIDKFVNNKTVIVAGSTWQEDEEELDHFANFHPDIKFIIAPHEIDEEHLKDIEKLYHRSVRCSVFESNTTEVGWLPEFNKANVLLIDNIGMLASLYHYATIAYLGGGFGDDGVHNVLEAAVYGKPVIFGPVYEKYAEATGLVDCGAAFPVENSLELEKTLNNLLENDSAYREACSAAKEYVYANRGATEKITSFIQEKRLLTN